MVLRALLAQPGSCQALGGPGRAVFSGSSLNSGLSLLSTTWEHQPPKEMHTHIHNTHTCACPQGLLHRFLEVKDTQSHSNTPSITSGRPAYVSRRFKGDKPQLFFPQSPMTGSGGDLTGPETQLHRQVPRASARAGWATAPFKASSCTSPIAMRGRGVQPASLQGGQAPMVTGKKAGPIPRGLPWNGDWI